MFFCGITTFICVIIPCCVIFSFLWQIICKSLLGMTNVHYRYPPGPIRLPILGYMPFLGRNPPIALQKLGERFGSIFTIFLGNYRVVVLNDFNTIKEAFKEESFSGRPDLKMLAVRNGGVHMGFVCNEGKTWHEQRRFTLRQLKQFGLGREFMSYLVQEEVDELIQDLRTNLSNPVVLADRFNLAVLNSLWKITCGERYSHNDTRLQDILKKTAADLADTQYTGPLLFLPWLIKVAPKLTRWNEFVGSINSVHTFLKDIIQKHQNTYDSSTCRDFIDAYLTKIRKTTDPMSSFYKKNGEHSLLVVLLDLFMAGADTTSTTLAWSFLYMILYPKVQKKVQQEILNVLGQQPPHVEYRKKMPYTEATIMEILRKSSLVPMGLFHCTTSDIEFCGFHIHKNTVVMANLYNVHNNKMYWGDPHNFRPERFLTSSNQIRKMDAFLPFSTGKRSCPGENLAREELFLFFVGLLQQFEFKPDPSKPKPTENPKTGVISSPLPYSVLVSPINLSSFK